MDNAYSEGFLPLDTAAEYHFREQGEGHLQGSWGWLRRQPKQRGQALRNVLVSVSSVGRLLGTDMFLVRGL
jgi:hypothetical protein